MTIQTLEAASREVVVLLANGFWQSLVLAGLVAGALRLWRGASAETRYALWCMALLGVLCLSLQGVLDGGEEEGRSGSLPAKFAVFRTEVVAEAEMPFYRQMLSERSEHAVAAERALPVHLPEGSWTLWVAGLWAAGVLVFISRVLRGCIHLFRLKRASQPLAAAQVQPLCLWQERCGVRRPVSLRVCQGVCTPVVVGLHRPAILFPERLDKCLSPGELEQIGLHEMAHIGRCDDWAVLGQRVVQALLWCFPAVWWIGRHLDVEREIACDDWVVALTGQSRAYARSLAHLAELSIAGGRLPALAPGVVFGQSQIATRVGLLLRGRRQRSRRPSVPGLLGGGLPLFAALAILSACDNPFAPPTMRVEEPDRESARPATQPEILLDNLHLAMHSRDRDLYESLIDENFWFTEFDCHGDLVQANGREEELEIMGTRDGSTNGVFDLFRTFEFNFSLIRRYLEPGVEHPYAFVGDPDGHPQEDWEVFRGRVQMLMLDEAGDGFRVDQVMTFKVRRDGEGLWKLIRWDDDPLTGDCGTARRSKGVAAWVAVKAGGRG